MNVYDFDGTIYDGDSSVDFFKFCLRTHPGILRAVPRQLASALSLTLGRADLTQAKSGFYSYYRFIPNMDATLHAFWEGPGKRRLKAWYAGNHRADDCIASASPEFQLLPVCAMLGVERLVASQVDPTTGECLGANCRDEEKVRRVREAYPDDPIERAYSDSHADDCLAAAAREAFWVDGEKVIPWEQAPVKRR